MILVCTVYYVSVHFVKMEQCLSCIGFSRNLCIMYSFQLEPEYEGAAKELLKVGIPLAKVDGPEEKELADEYGVSGYPTLMVCHLFLTL